MNANPHNQKALFTHPVLIVENLRAEDIITTSGGHIDDDGNIYTPSDELTD